MLKERSYVMTRNSTRLYWMTNENWYRINEEKDCFELTEHAPARAVRSFNEWKKPKRRNSKYLFRKLRSLF